MNAAIPLPIAEPQPLAFKRKREADKLAKRLRHQVGKAIADFGMIEDGDKVMVCLSGGKDSYTMLDVLLQLQKKAPVQFSITAVNLDQKQPGFPEHVLPEYLKSIGVDYHIIEQDTYSVVSRVIPEGKTMCSLCSRLRRGALYTYAEEHGFTKIALGHHRDDLVNTFFLNLFFHAKLSGMPPKLLSDDGKHVVIRPLAYVREDDIEQYADAKGFPIIPCNLCGSQENLQRKQVKKMLAQWEKESPGRVETMSRALGDIRPSQLSDPKLFDFMALGKRGDALLPDAHAWLAGGETAAVTFPYFGDGATDFFNPTSLGDTVTLDLLRTPEDGGDREPVTVEVVTAANPEAAVADPDADPVPYLGILVGMQYEAPFDIDFTLQHVGGPSAGMMFSLAIVDMLTDGSMTGGGHVAGTGTIDPTGAVGAIGGIQQKLLGASGAGARLFLAPDSNCGEVAGHEPDGMTVVPVGTLSDARDVVETWAADPDSTFPTCTDVVDSASDS